MVWKINDLIESISQAEPYVFGRPREFYLKMLLKLTLFSYSRGVFSSREIEQFARENLPARWLCQEQIPSYRTICRFRISPEMDGILQKSFDSLIELLRELRLIDDTVCIDGTKMLANANKYSFVWKKNTYRFDEMNRNQIISLLTELKNHIQ